MKRYKTVDEYVASREKWQEEIKRLREILLATELTEEVKWGGPCYTFEGKNVVGIGGFKSYFGLWFYQGVLLEDKLEEKIHYRSSRAKKGAGGACRLAVPPLATKKAGSPARPYKPLRRGVFCRRIICD